MAVRSTGVYTKEQDVSQYISTTSPLEPAAVLYASYGPYNTIKTITSITELMDTFGDVVTSAYVGLIGIKKYFKYGNQIKLVRVEGASDTYGDLTLVDAEDGATLVLRSLYKGAFANKIAVTYSSGTLSVYVNGKIRERFTVAKSEDGDVNSDFKTAINDVSAWIYVEDDEDADANANEILDFTVLSYLENGVSGLPTKTNFIGTATGGPSSGPSGLQCFAHDGITCNVLLCPDAAALSSATDAKDVMKEIESIAESRKDLLGIVEIPAGKTRDNAVTYINDTAAHNSTYVATFWPWVQFTESSIDSNVYIPGGLFGLMCLAKNDKLQYPWYGAFGYQRGIITEALEVEFATSTADRDVLAGAQINTIIKESGIGVVNYGNYTKYSVTQATQSINVRRLMLFVKQGLSAAAKALLGEPSDQVTRAQFKAMADRFLGEIETKRGLTSFNVVCDDTNNPGSLVDQKIMVADIKVQPTRAIEIIELNMQITSTGATFDD